MRGVLGTAVLAVSLVLLLGAERIAGAGTTRTVLLALALLGLAGGLGWRTWELVRARGAARKAEARLLLGDGGVVLALLLYALSTDWGLEQVLGLGHDAAERVGTALGALWPAVLVTSLAALLFMELAYRKMPVPAAVELRRIRTAGQAGLGLALSVVFLFSVNYAVSQQNIKTDLSYFRTTEPSDATLDMVKALGSKVRVVLVYPEVNEVLDQLRPYFQELDDASDLLEVEVKDHALIPELARKHKIEGNGRVVLLQGEGEAQQAEKFRVGTRLEAARRKLRSLDGRFQKNFTRLTRQERELYMTTGHDERTDSDGHGEGKGDSTRELTDALSRSNVSTEKLGMAQGLAQRVPEGAPAVAVIGPRKAFLEEEVDALRRYIERGGRLILMLDPDVDHGLDPLLKALGLKMETGVLASKEHHLRRTYSKADRAIVYTNEFSSHPTVTMPSRHSDRVATVFYKGGALARYKGDGVIDEAEVSFPISSPEDVWRDLDGDWERDDDEKSGVQRMMAAVRIPASEKDGEDGRAVVVADGDFVTDRLIRNPGNALVFGDVLQWMLGEEQIVGDTSSEEDVRIEHTKEEDQIWFYGTSFGAPLPLLAIGVWIVVRRRRGKRETHHGRDGDRSGGGDGGSGSGESEAESAQTAAEERR